QPVAREARILLGVPLPISSRPEREPSDGGSSLYRAETGAGGVGGAAWGVEMEQLPRDHRARDGAGLAGDGLDSLAVRAGPFGGAGGLAAICSGGTGQIRQGNRGAGESRDPG